MNVAEYITQFLIKQNVRHVFGLQGGAILKLVDTMVGSGQIFYVQNFHEQASAFCADAYSRVSGNLGVALATSGPGATNLVTGIANAHLDSIPTLFITGQEFSSRLVKKDGVRSNGFQDLDIVSLVKSITKYAAIVTDGQKIAYELEKALYLAKSGRPGAVLLDIPIDIQFQEIDHETLEHFKPQSEEFVDYNSEITKFYALLKQAKRPVILGGGGIMLAGAKNAFRQFADNAGIPVALTLNGLDCYTHFIGFSGLYGNPAAALAVYNADILIVFGARLGQHQVGKTKENYTRGEIVHIDIDPLELGRIMPEALSIRADLNSFLTEANSVLPEIELPNWADWRQTIARWQSEHPNKPSFSAGVSPIALVHEAQKHFSQDAIISSDVGQNQMWVAQAICLRDSQRLLNSSGLGSMGYALPAAIAAKLYLPHAQSIAFMGDGGLQINIQELQLVSLKKLDIKIFVFNNGALGLIKTSQGKYFGERYYGCAAPDFGCVDLEALAKAYKLAYVKIESMNDFNKLDNIFSSQGPNIIEVIVDPHYPLYTRYDISTLFLSELIDG